MSREIKFRAWRESQKFMLTPHSLVDLFEYGSIVNPEGVVWMQYTGLKDNDKIDVYESDVVEAFGGHTVGVIVMHNGSWMIKTNKDLESLFDAYDSCDLHVIGNIHQNHELLK